jgi:hypothetical protein
MPRTLAERSLTGYAGSATPWWKAGGTTSAGTGHGPRRRVRHAAPDEQGAVPAWNRAAEGARVAAFVFIHGAGDAGWYWHLVEAELRERGYDTVAPDLPCEDDSAGLPEYADTVAAAAGDRTGLVVVAQSLGGFTAPLVCDRVPVELLVLVAPMIPAPGEAPAAYWSATRYEQEARKRYDGTVALFYQDVPPELAAEALKRTRGQSEARLGEPSPLRAWPDVPTRVLICRDDRLFPPGFLRRVARERLGITPDEIEGGHTPALSHPHELADRLVAYAAGQGLIPTGRRRRPPNRASSVVGAIQPGFK